MTDQELTAELQRVVGERYYVRDRFVWYVINEQTKEAVMMRAIISRGGFLHSLKAEPDWPKDLDPRTDSGWTEARRRFDQLRGLRETL